MYKLKILTIEIEASTTEWERHLRKQIWIKAVRGHIIHEFHHPKR